MNKIIAILTIGFLITTTACKRKYDLPPIKTPESGPGITIDSIKARLGSASVYKFNTSRNLYCVVIGDEVTGNFYKEVYVRDATGSIHVNLPASGGLYIGDSIRINLNGIKVQKSNNLIELDSVDIEKYVAKLASGLNPQPKLVTISQAVSTPSLQSQLIQINDAEFLAADQNQNFADAVNKIDVNRGIKVCGSNTLTVRTSGYSNFASSKTPTGNGKIVGILGQYGSTMQLYVRNPNELAMTAPLCVVALPTLALGTPVATLNETFSSQTLTNNPVNLTGWHNIDEQGSRTWQADVNSGNYRAKATSFGSSNPDASNKIWLITPPLIYTTAKTFSFQSAMAFASSGHTNGLQVFVSTTYNGANLTTPGTWTNVTSSFSIAPTSGSNYTFINLGTSNFGGVVPGSYTGNIFIGFVYSGSKPSNFTTNFYLDNISYQ